MLSRIYFLISLYLVLGYSFSKDTINIENYYSSLINKDYKIQTWDIFYDEYDLDVNNIRQNYNNVEKYNWIETPTINIQITGSENNLLFRFYSNRYEDALVSLLSYGDSLMINYPTDLGYGSQIKIPKLISINGYEKDGFGVEVISPETVRISVSFNEGLILYYWLNKKNGLEFMYSDSEYTKVIGIPTLDSARE